ncbi:hypothetical protein SADUNF_Sadunf11G0091400 [Salix dunnii]|uniref:Uncharacterized protein n=1 Tax=Salix dunnii TaxID=1413687 RepID=A0A835MQM6_9ROSI|nr:hypothetical protein SADUNF_Sadunf11G0091400 [Salix dunnii]
MCNDGFPTAWHGVDIQRGRLSSTCIQFLSFLTPLAVASSSKAARRPPIALINKSLQRCLHIPNDASGSCAPGTPSSERSMDSLGVVEIESAQSI